MTFDHLSDGELAARLVQHGIPAGDARYLVRYRDDGITADVIAGILGDDQ